MMTDEGKETPAERAARILSEACATLERTAEMANRKYVSALPPGEDAMEPGQRGIPKPEPPREIDWNARIEAAIAAERKRTDKRIADGLAGLAEAEHATRSLTIEIRELRAAVTELRLLIASEKSAPVDLPRLPPTRELN